MRRLAPIVALALLIASQACGSEEAAPPPLATAPPSEVEKGDTPGGVADPPAGPEGEDDPIPADEDDTSEPMMPAAPDHATPKPGCTAKATLAGYTTWFFFTRPDKPCNGEPGSGMDSHILNELIRLIDSVPAGGRIDGHIFSITVDSVAEALLNAQARGVDVWISTDGAVASSTDPSKTQYLDKLQHKVYCTATGRTSCVSTAANAISHTKLFTFSTATTPDGVVSQNVVWFGSANQTYASGMKLYNNTVTIFGDAPLYTKLRAYLDDLYYRRARADYYDPSSGRGHLLCESADVYVSPESTTDLVVNRLDDVTPDATCRVRVMQASIRDSRLAVVDRHALMKAGGCQVTIVAETVEPKALAALKRANIPVRKMPIHDKVFIVYGKYGNAYEHRVYTGSHNLSGSANRKYDEIFVKLAAEKGDDHPVYDAYVVPFEDAYGSGTPL